MEAGILDTLAETALDATIQHGIPYLAKRGTEAGRYYLSQVMRNPKLEKKPVDYAMKKGTPKIQKFGSEVLDQLSTNVRPNERYKTDRKDLDGGALDFQNMLNQKWLPEFHMRSREAKNTIIEDLIPG